MSFFGDLFKSGNKKNVKSTFSDTGFHYVCQCRLNTFAGTTPSNTDFFDTADYNKVVKLAYQYIDENGLLGFAGFVQGDQYFVELWTAHIIYNHADASEKLKLECVDIITKYADSSLNTKVASEEQEWLRRNKLRK
jgi:glucokinase